MNTTLRFILIIFMCILISACSSLSTRPEIGSDNKLLETDTSLGNAQGEDDVEDGENLEINPPMDACFQEDILVVVYYDHRWNWSVDGTEATGTYTGVTKGSQRLLLNQDKNGNLLSDSFTIFYTQSGIIQGDPDACSVNGKGMAEFTLSGTCRNGNMELEWIELGTGESEATMVCGSKNIDYNTYYPPQAENGIKVGDDGMVYITSDSTFFPQFRDVSMEWTIRLVPEGQSY